MAVDVCDYEEGLCELGPWILGDEKERTWV
jgi:hypothetical protein